MCYSQVKEAIEKVVALDHTSKARKRESSRAHSTHFGDKESKDKVSFSKLLALSYEQIGS